MSLGEFMEILVACFVLCMSTEILLLVGIILRIVKPETLDLDD